MSHKNNSGFSAVIILLSVLVVTVVGFAGWYVWQSNKEEAVVTNYAECAAQPDAKIQESYPEVCVYKEQRFTNPDQITQAPPTETEASNQKYLTISEWGVKIALTDVLAEASYEYKTFDGGSKGVSLLVGIPGDATNACQEQAIISRIEYKAYLNDQVDGGYLQGFEGGVHIGDYYFFLTPSQSACNEYNTPEEKTIQDKATLVRSEWIKQSNTITSS